MQIFLLVGEQFHWSSASFTVHFSLQYLEKVFDLQPAVLGQIRAVKAVLVLGAAVASAKGLGSDGTGQFWVGRTHQLAEAGHDRPAFGRRVRGRRVRMADFKHDARSGGELLHHALDMKELVM